MKHINIVIFVFGLIVVSTVAAKDVFPEFTESSFEFAIPTNTLGALNDKSALIGTNYVYKLNGQIFTNSVSGHIQSISEGFSGNTDSGTPWKTLTKLLKVYQNGSPENDLMDLYDGSSKESLSKIYANDKIKTRFQNIGSSLVGMQVILGYKFQGGYLACIKLDYKDGHQETTPFYFVLEQNSYKLSVLKIGKPDLSFLNIGAYLNKGTASKR